MLWLYGKRNVTLNVERVDVTVKVIPPTTCEPPCPVGYNCTVTSSREFICSGNYYYTPLPACCSLLTLYCVLWTVYRP